MAAKSDKIELSTFQKCGKSEVAGYKTADENEETFVNFIWCKLCAKHKGTIFAYPTLTLA